MQKIVTRNQQQTAGSPKNSSIYVPDLIISGGQTGADLGALRGALYCNIPTGGYAPKNWITETGPMPDLGIVYGLVESSSRECEIHTRQNIQIADAVILICRNFDSPGSRLTYKSAAEMGVPVFKLQFTIPSLAPLYWFEDLRSWLDWHTPSILMFAGNRESVARGIQNWTVDTVKKIFDPARDEDCNTLEFFA